MRCVLALMKREVLWVARERAVAVLLVLQPLLFIIVMSYALKDAYGNGSKKEVLVAYQSSDAVAHAIADELRAVGAYRFTDTDHGSPLSGSQVEARVKSGAFAGVILPNDVQAEAMSGGDVNVSVVTDPSASDVLIGPLRATVEGVVRDVVLRSRLQAVNPSASAPQISVQMKLPAGEAHINRPDVLQQNVPGFAVFGVLWIVNIASQSLLMDKRDGILARVLMTRARRWQIIVAKAVPYVGVTCVQMALMFAVGRVIFGMGLGSSFPALAYLTVTLGAAVVAISLLFATLGRSLPQAGSLSALFILVTSMVGGSFLPIDIMPGTLRLFAHVTPQFWAISGYQDVIVRGRGLSAVVSNGGVLLTFAALAGAIALTRFRFLAQS